MQNCNSKENITIFGTDNYNSNEEKAVFEKKNFNNEQEIKSKSKEINEKVQDLNEEDKSTIKKYEEFIPHFIRMKELATILLNKRKKDGSLDLDIPESKIILNQDGIAIDVRKYELTISNSIIEQFMLIANETVAEKFYWLEAPFIYRVHEVPEIEK
ncbi:MAG: RNB domain-containing ribonuclease, partial [Clostridia bacterium]|nr:RNB domain-containing ribonuclease [Clostridia bacterium]